MTVVFRKNTKMSKLIWFLQNRTFLFGTRSRTVATLIRTSPVSCFWCMSPSSSVSYWSTPLRFITLDEVHLIVTCNNFKSVKFVSWSIRFVISKVPVIYGSKHLYSTKDNRSTLYVTKFKFKKSGITTASLNLRCNRVGNNKSDKSFI